MRLEINESKRKTENERPLVGGTNLFSVSRFIVGTFVLSLSLNNLSLANTSPEFVPLNDKYISEGAILIFEIESFDIDGDLITLGVTSRPSGASFVDNGDGTAICTWTPQYSGPLSSVNSPYQFTFVASDGQSSTSITVYANVSNNNRAPIISAPDTVHVEVGDSVMFSASALDPDFENITWSVTSLPMGAEFSVSPDLEFLWAPLKEDSGQAEFAFVAQDPWGLSDTAKVIVSVVIGPDYEFAISQDSAYGGETIVLTTSLKNRSEVASFDLLLHFDPSALSLLNINPAGNRVEGFEFFDYSVHDNSIAGNVRIVGVANLPEGDVTPPLESGDGALFSMSFFVSTQLGLGGMFIPLNFVIGDSISGANNIIVDGEGSLIPEDLLFFNQGGIQVREVNQNGIGDINLNGIPFEVADVLRFSNFFIDPFVYRFNPQQFINSDVNQDGIAASISDLVAMITLITSGGNPSKPVYGNTDQVASVWLEENSESKVLSINSAAPLGAGFFVFEISAEFAVDGKNVGPDISTVVSMNLASQFRSDTLRALLYSLDGNYVTKGSRELFEIGLEPYQNVTLLSAELVTPDGESIEVVTGAEKESTLPGNYNLSQNYPNPFNPSTKILFEIPLAGNVALSIFDILGRSVRSLTNERYEAGKHEVIWDGKDDSGSSVASGVYFYRLLSNDKMISRKMTLLK
ncbi:MAG: T9SS type A sorting domain-containing protein [candidate division Zixibacteria bacterium]|nr:T9SS type A sorting domain-containing protein [candidate division Zixibacteria bacterium]